MNSATRTLCRGIALGLAAAIGLPAAAAAQQLWNIEEVAAQPATPILMDGVAVSAAAASAPTAEAATVQVAIDYLRLGMGYLQMSGGAAAASSRTDTRSAASRCSGSSAPGRTEPAS